MRVKTTTGHEAIVHASGPRWYSWIYNFYSESRAEQGNLSAYAIRGVPDEVVHIRKVSRRGDWEVVIGEEVTEEFHNKVDAQRYVEEWLGLRQPTGPGGNV